MKKQLEITSPKTRKKSGTSEERDCSAFDSQPEWMLDINLREKMLKKNKAKHRNKKKHVKDAEVLKKKITDKDSLSLESSSADEEYYKRYKNLKALKRDEIVMPLTKEEIESSIPARLDFKLQGKRLNDKKGLLKLNVYG